MAIDETLPLPPAGKDHKCKAFVPAVMRRELEQAAARHRIGYATLVSSLLCDAVRQSRPAALSDAGRLSGDDHVDARLPVDIAARLKVLADCHGVPLSVVVRSILSTWLSRQSAGRNEHKVKLG